MKKPSTEHLAAIKKYADAGYDHICIHQVGKEQKGFFEFYEREILPHLGSIHTSHTTKHGRSRGRRLR
jgi:hypothetical protein